MIQRFRVFEEGNLNEQFLWVQQEGTVDEYELKFVKYASPLEIPEDFLMAAFVKGLDKKIRIELRTLDPPSLKKAME